ncbi:MAG: hypothetical protein US74_C0036G0011 [Parcubacteria group bacterium GW2011_GWA2_38_13]|nr:MAG: hypothetical protein US74_C0036G0011 [Parcubacteria group bacterium GW2011_GWA2_38_13]
MDTSNNTSSYNKLGLALFFELSGWIAIPVIGAVFLGKWLDEKFNAGPTLTLVCVGVAFIITIFGIIRKGKKMMKQMDNKKK